MIEINIYVINYSSSLRDDHKHSILIRKMKSEMMERLLVFYYTKDYIKK